MPNIIGLLFCVSGLSIVTFMWITTFQGGDRTDKVMSSFMFIPLMIALTLIICGLIADMIGA